MEKFRTLRVYDFWILELETVTEKHQKSVTKSIRKASQKALSKKQKMLANIAYKEKITTINICYFKATLKKIAK